MAFHPEQEASTCDECESRLVTTDGEIYCEGCGLCLEDRAFEMDPGYRTDAEGRIITGHVGPPKTPGLGSAVGSMISYGARDAHGRALNNDPTTRTRLHRIRRVAQHGASGRQRQEDDAGRAIRAITARLGLPKSIEQRAVFLFREMRRVNLADPGRDCTAHRLS